MGEPVNSRKVTIYGIAGVPEVRPGDDLAFMLLEAAQRQGTPLQPGDVLVITQKVVSKAEGRIIDLSTIIPSPFASDVGLRTGKDARLVEVILRETARIVKMDRGTIITETHHGFICANAGVDKSNVPGAEMVTLLPADPDASARRIFDRIREATGYVIPVIISDTWGRPWREGIVNFAIGVAGLEALIDYRGQEDPFGNELKVTMVAIADELAAAAELVTGKLNRVPAAIVRGYAYQAGPGTARVLLRDPSRDLFR
jgi:coenzyme F420-0:L-glutamate ligase/coenzyme F420-1:gamma-L-glutamate ligase